MYLTLEKLQQLFKTKTNTKTTIYSQIQFKKLIEKLFLIIIARYRELNLKKMTSKRELKYWLVNKSLKRVRNRFKIQN